MFMRVSDALNEVRGDFRKISMIFGGFQRSYKVVFGGYRGVEERYMGSVGVFRVFRRYFMNFPRIFRYSFHKNPRSSLISPLNASKCL